MSLASMLLRTQHGTALWCGVNVFDETQHIPARLPQIDDVKVVQIATGGWYSLFLDDAQGVLPEGGRFPTCLSAARMPTARTLSTASASRVVTGFRDRPRVAACGHDILCETACGDGPARGSARC